MHVFTHYARLPGQKKRAPHKHDFVLGLSKER